MGQRLVVTFSDGSRWGISTKEIAAHRAAYYANRSGRRGDEYIKVFNAEFDSTLEDEAILTDWAGNCMNWEDVAHAVFIIPSEKEGVNKRKEWPNADKVVEAEG